MVTKMGCENAVTHHALHSLAPTDTRQHHRMADSPKKGEKSPKKTPKKDADTADEDEETVPDGLGSLKREKTFAAFEITDAGPKEGAKPPARLLASQDKKKKGSVAKEDVDSKLTAAEERRKVRLHVGCLEISHRFMLTEWICPSRTCSLCSRCHRACMRWIVS